MDWHISSFYTTLEKWGRFNFPPTAIRLPTNQDPNSTNGCVTQATLPPLTALRSSDRSANHCLTSQPGYKFSSRGLHQRHHLLMSIRPEAHFPFDRNEWHSLARERMRWATNHRTFKHCGHQFCDLSQPCCCACLDTRPHFARYNKYVDGRGMVAEAKRWSDYCPGCKDHYANSWPPKLTNERMRQLPPPRCVTCGQAGHAMWECPRMPSDDESVLSSPGRRVSESVSDSHGTSATMRSEETCTAPLRVTKTGGVRGVSAAQNATPSPSAAASSSGRSATALQQQATNGTMSAPQPVPRLTPHQQRRTRARENFERSFGTMAEIANDPEYVSPITSLYSDAYARFQQREQEQRERQAQRQSRLGSLRSVRDHLMSSLSSLASSSSNRDEREPFEPLEPVPPLRIRIPSISPPAQTTAPQAEYEAASNPSNSNSSENTNTQHVLESLRRRLEEDDRRLLLRLDERNPSAPSRERFGQRPSVFGRWHDMPINPTPSSVRTNLSPLPRDSRPTVVRPPTPEALSKDDLTISDECKICFSQHCDMLLLPCAHLALCEVPFG